MRERGRADRKTRERGRKWTLTSGELFRNRRAPSDLSFRSELALTSHLAAIRFLSE